MGELENKKNLAIQDVLNAVREQMKKDGIVSNDMWFDAVESVLHFNKIKYIEKKENGDIEISYPFGKETYGNRCYITISPDGTAHIRGIQTSPEKRYEHINPRGDFDFYLKIENWVETENITEVTRNGYGKEPLPNGILDNILPEVIDEEFMVRKLTSLYPELLYEQNSPESTSAELNEDAIRQAKGKTSTIPTFWGNYSNEEILCLHPEAAAIFMEQIIKQEENGEIDEDVILYENKGYDSWNGNTYDIGYNIESGNLFGAHNLYVIEKEGIVLQDEDLLTYPNGHQVPVQPVNDTKLEEQYNRYKEAVLNCLDNEVHLNYAEVVNDDLRKDPDFIKRVDMLLAESEKYSLGNFAEVVREAIGIMHQDHSIDEVGNITGRTEANIRTVIDEVAKDKTEQEKQQGQQGKAQGE